MTCRIQIRCSFSSAGKTSIIRKNRDFPDYWRCLNSADKNGHWISIQQVKKTTNNYLFKQVNSRYPQIRSRYFRVSCNYCNKGKVDNVQMNYFKILFKVVYLDLQNPNLMSISVSQNQKLSIIQKTRNFPDY